MSVNRVTISGNLGFDPELRRTQSGMAVMSFNVAVNERRKNGQTGEYEDYCNWVPCTIFGKRAESLANYLSKGTKVAVDGRLRYEQWDDKQTGQKRSKLSVIVDDLDFMSQRQGGQQGGYQQQQPQQQPQYAQATVYDAPYETSDIPF